ncbi:MAG: hypothetical protein HZB64_07605 [Rhodocyclales bacterium]|nr:hypothetical protein [Rhodocyclales bacterium]
MQVTRCGKLLRALNASPGNGRCQALTAGGDTALLQRIGQRSVLARHEAAAAA